jgi:hypothetical protein
LLSSYENVIFLQTYANGQRIEEIVCRGEVLWHGEVCSVEIALSDDEQPAIGTGLLKSCVMTMDFRNDTLSIEKPTQENIWFKA